MKAGNIVTYSFPLQSYLSRMVHSDILDNLDDQLLWCCKFHDKPDVILRNIKPDTVIFCNINHVKKIKKKYTDIILIADLYGPIHFEGFLLDNSSSLDSMCNALVKNFQKIDYVITVSERQKYFWAAYLSLAGFSFSDLDALVCPLSLDISEVKRNPSESMSIIFSGGFYPWQNPERFLRVTASFLDSIPGGKLYIFGGPHKGMDNAEEVNEMLSDLEKEHSSVIYQGYRPVEELFETISNCWCALEIMEKNIERELAITGRTVEFLSAGVPVIYNNYSSLSQMIDTYDAGWTVNTDNTDSLESVLLSIYRDGLISLQEKSEGALNLVESEFNREMTTDLLVHFISSHVKKRKRRTLYEKVNFVPYIMKKGKRIMQQTLWSSQK